jgi:hypothetical protein
MEIARSREMDAHMSESLFIYNERSGTCDLALVAEIEELFARAGWPIGQSRTIDDQPLPSGQELEDQGIGLAIILGGDGSLAAAAQALDGWDGTLLALPGGTMNLLAHALHGDLGPLEIVKAYLSGEGAVLRTPVIRAGDVTAYTGIIIGPTAAWGQVREALRNRDLAALADEVPNAIAATFDGPGVSLEGSDTSYPAIFVEPGRGGLKAYGVLADSAGDLFRHGWAWLSGDFRDGPSESLGVAPALHVRSGAATVDLLIDGEPSDGPVPFELQLARSGVRFFAAQGEAGWS